VGALEVLDRNRAAAQRLGRGRRAQCAPNEIEHSQRDLLILVRLWAAGVGGRGAWGWWVRAAWWRGEAGVTPATGRTLQSGPGRWSRVTLTRVGRANVALDRWEGSTVTFAPVGTGATHGAPPPPPGPTHGHATPAARPIHAPAHAPAIPPPIDLCAPPATITSVRNKEEKRRTPPTEGRSRREIEYV
jgi:hypothetical protein